MARKGIMTSLLDDKFTAVNKTAETPSPTSSEAPVRRGAFGMMSRAADEMAAKVEAAEAIKEQLLTGTHVIELAPNDLDGSFVVDRLEDDDDKQFDELVAAIRERGQDSPILVRPHPSIEGRYQIVFGHRRARAAKALGLNVRAIVRELSDQEHVVAQGQENTARADLSFIERALFAQKLQQTEFDNDTIMSALAINKTVLSKMVSVTTNIPEDIILAIGAARGIGRDRWYDLSTKLKALNSSDTDDLMSHEEFKSAASDVRFAKLYDAVKMASKPAKKSKTASAVNAWAPLDKSVSVTSKAKAKSYEIELTNQEAKPFGEWISSRLDRLFDEYRQTIKQNTGD